MARRRYSDEERAAGLAALKANSGNLERTAHQVGVPRNTLKAWAKDPDAAAPAKVRQQKSRDLAVKLDDIANQLADAIPGKIGKASMRDCATSMGIAIDKRRLLRNQSTVIQESRGAGGIPDLVDLLKLPFEELVRLHRETLGLPASDR